MIPRTALAMPAVKNLYPNIDLQNITVDLRSISFLKTLQHKLFLMAWLGNPWGKGGDF